MAFPVYSETHRTIVGSDNFKGSDLKRRLGYKYIGGFYVQMCSTTMFRNSFCKAQLAHCGKKIFNISLFYK